MKTKYQVILASGLLFATLASGRAQSIYTPYAFTNIAGLPGIAGTNDGTGITARFDHPGSVVVDSAGIFYVTDIGNHTVRKITPAGTVTTLAGLAGTPGTNDGPGVTARFNQPACLDVASNGDIYLADYNNHTIRKVTSEGVVTTLAGAPGVPGTNDGPASVARFSYPIGVAVDSATNIYVGDGQNHTIRKITPDGQVTTLAGSPGHPGSADGTGDAARFNNPHHVKVDAEGNLYVADTLNDTIRKVTPAGVVTTLAGSAGQVGSADGIASAARFNQPYGVLVTTNGNLYVADTFNHTIRRITSDGRVTTLAGLAGHVGTVDGVGSSARLYHPLSVAITSGGNLFVVDTYNDRITQGSPLLQFEPTAGNLTISNGRYLVRLLGPSGRNAIVDATADLSGWTPVQTNALPAEGLNLSVPLDPSKNQLIRARLAP